jgi:3-hydroxyisobutyrate dehydrogenase
MKVAILGTGHMGTAMALRLIETGHQVTVWNRRRDRLAPLGQAGAEIAGDLADAVVDAEVVITMLADGSAVRSVTTWLLSAMGPDAVWVQASTVGAAWADRLHRLAVEHGRTMLDAPVSGSTGPAHNGTLTWLVAGPQQAVDAARPVLDALNASDRLGVPRESFLDVLSDGPLGMPYALAKAELMTAGDYTPGFPIELALKDIRLIEDAENQVSPLVRELDRRLTSAVIAGHMHEDLAAVAAVD